MLWWIKRKEGLEKLTFTSYIESKSCKGKLQFQLLDKFEWMKSRARTNDDKDRKLWRSVIGHVLKGHMNKVFLAFSSWRQFVAKMINCMHKIWPLFFFFFSVNLKLALTLVTITLYSCVCDSVFRKVYLSEFYVL